MNEINIPRIPATIQAIPAKKSPKYSIAPPIPNKMMAHIKTMVFLIFTALIGRPSCGETERKIIPKINQTTPCDNWLIYAEYIPITNRRIDPMYKMIFWLSITSKPPK